MPRQSRERRQAFARYNSSREPMVVPHGLSVRLGCRAHQEHLLDLAVQTLSGKTRQEKSHHRVAHTIIVIGITCRRTRATMRILAETTSIASTPTVSNGTW